MACCLATVLLAGCGQTRVARVEDRYPRSADPVIAAGDLEMQLRAEASRWHGTPHRMGGTDLNGVDCSGLVQRIDRDLFGLQMPRTARQQSLRGIGVGQHDLEPGDLVFFRPPGKKDHVGIYLGKGEFVHTSAKRGVMVSRMDLNYWRKYYWKSRRILQ
ncbi:C40 family peptidase [Desulfosarcina sp.]|uniref:C40 family peptidase n=1 Tax=Desulfosarcina sp. TaxID=2027861 RepID=UPI0029AFA9F0|nr:NlpC/P60 family protein [Desulfosarcina sp.]MDX2453384.1 NlpC/P60 family protein [Desulfosarcina sp.]